MLMLNREPLHTHTHKILIYAAVQRVRDRGAWSKVTFKKNKKYQNVLWNFEILFM